MILVYTVLLFIHEYFITVRSTCKCWIVARSLVRSTLHVALQRWNPRPSILGNCCEAHRPASLFRLATSSVSLQAHLHPNQSHPTCGGIAGIEKKNRNRHVRTGVPIAHGTGGARDVHITPTSRRGASATSLVVAPLSVAHLHQPFRVFVSLDLVDAGKTSGEGWFGAKAQ